MKGRGLVGLVAVVSLSACTPDLDALVAWVADQRAAAVADGRPCPEWADAIAWRGLPEHFAWVIERESNCRPDAVNRSSGAMGLTQIMPSWLGALCRADITCTKSDLLDPALNLDAAALVYAAQGPGAWSQTW
jgi:soluble lytic murein transglycosylase-like protein